jgi:heme oxygenase
LYASGLLHIAPIYITFETLWQEIIRQPTGHEGSDVDHPSESNVGPIDNASDSSDAADHMTNVLRDLFLPGLMRSDRLRSDIRAITGWSPQVVNEQLKAVSREGRLAEFIRHIRRAVEKRPHVLIAYSYILFMALFAGGRFLRASLESAAERDAFWEKSPSPVRPGDLSCHRSPRPPPSTPAEETDLTTGFFDQSDTKHRRHVMNPDGTSLPLSFFHFAGKSDGEELKLEFKRRLADAEDKVGPQERHDIVQEAICIFENMLLLVAQLDTVCDTALDANADADPIMASPAAFGTRLRDSVAVAKERRAVAQNLSSDSEGRPDYPNFRGVRSGHIHHCTAHSQNSRGHHHDASSDSNGHDWHSTHASTPSQTGSDDQDECCTLLGKSVRFEPKAPILDRKRGKPFLSMDGSGSRRSSSLCPAFASDYEKNEFAPAPAPKATATKTIVSNIAMMAALAALIGTMYFARGRGEETPA